MQKGMRWLYWSIEINLILWMVVFGAVMGGTEPAEIKPIVIGGFVLSAVLQHWAYYNLRRASRA